MAVDMVKTIMKTEAQGRLLENEAKKNVEKMIADAEIQAEIIYNTTVEQAQNQANLILSDAEYSSNGIIKQAEKLAELRERKSISDTEKKYTEAVKLIFEEIIR